MKKFRLYYDKDKEEVCLNEMSDKGWAMTKFFLGCYTFVQCKPGQYTYLMDMPEGLKKFNSNINRQEYVQFVEETGAEYVGEWFFWALGMELLAAACLIRSAQTDIELIHIIGFSLIGVIIGSFIRMILKTTSKIKALEKDKIIES